MDTLRLQDFIGSTLYVTVRPSSRLVIGKFVAVDAQCNLLLDSVQERYTSGSGGSAGGSNGSCMGTDRLKHSYNTRMLGLVSVPRNTITSITLEKHKLNSIINQRGQYI